MLRIIIITLYVIVIDVAITEYGIWSNVVMALSSKTTFMNWSNIFIIAQTTSLTKLSTKFLSCNIDCSFYWSFLFKILYFTQILSTLSICWYEWRCCTHTILIFSLRYHICITTTKIILMIWIFSCWNSFTKIY